ncbi:MAG: hypothetical protein WAW41_10545, partial [Methylobacter sp.]
CYPFVDAKSKSALAAHLEPAHFFSCDGLRTSQGPELLAYRIKGQPMFKVVPFPSVGRVGQFINWFENASGSYREDPVLAAIPAIGKVNGNGSLILVKKGRLA